MSNERYILIVDDEPLLTNFVKRSVETLGFFGLTAQDGIEAQGILEAWKKQVVLALIDLDMPIINGPDTAAALLKTKNGLPIIFMSGWGNEERSREQFPRLLPNEEFLFKPFTHSQLADAITVRLGIG